MNQISIIVLLFLISLSSFGQCNEKPDFIDLVFSEEGAAYSCLQNTLDYTGVNDSLILFSVYTFQDTIAFPPIWDRHVSKPNWQHEKIKIGYYYLYIDLIESTELKRTIICSIYNIKPDSTSVFLCSFEAQHCKNGESSSVEMDFVENERIDFL